jgi:laccase
MVLMMMPIGDWWAMDLAAVARRMKQDNFFDYFPSASTINGKLGDLFNCSGNNQLSHI